MMPAWLPITQYPELENYRNFSKIAEGGFGEIYSAQGGDEQKVIFKRMKASCRENAMKRASFEREIHYLEIFSHPRIPKLLKTYATPEETFFIMEYIAGPTLTALLKGSSQGAAPLPLSRAFEIALQISEVLDYLHHFHDGPTQGVLHCDLKPSNLIVSPDRGVVLIDFSLASQPMPKEPSAGGTGFYMAPERFAGENPTPQSDLFSLGLVFFEMLTGRPLLVEHTYFGNFSKLLSKKYLDEIGRTPLAETLQSILRQCLAFLPTDRFASAEDFSKAMQVSSAQLGI